MMEEFPEAHPAVQAIVNKKVSSIEGMLKGLHSKVLLENIGSGDRGMF